ncbi:MAG: DegT/DnrJ/EryC1/StrS family aminotransferase [Lachnospiraceae bacterium]|nr:DegT/DnrJ/EryC1/StrS family aminotransferase [Lachnospiraceae bacterium]
MEKSVFVTKAYLPPRAEFDEYLDKIWNSAWLTNMGNLHEELKEKLRAYLGVSGIELFVNGHLALEMCIQAFGFPKGSEIITTPFTFASTAHAIVRQGLKPVFCDIRESDCTIDPEKIEELITDRTVAILPVHVYGNIADVYRIGEIAEKHGLKVIYDAAHAFGEKLNGTGAGNFGDASMFSFHATKVYNTIEGGAVTFNGDKYNFGMMLYQLKNFGIMDQEHVEAVGGNAKMNELQAAMGLCNLKHIDELIAARKEIDALYREKLTDKGVRFMKHRPEIEYNYSYMPVITDARDELFDKLSRHKIYARKYFYPCINAYDCYKGEYDPDETPVARDISRRILTLPIYQDLEHETIEEICRIITG